MVKRTWCWAITDLLWNRANSEFARETKFLIRRRNRRSRGMGEITSQVPAHEPANPTPTSGLPRLGKRARGNDGLPELTYPFHDREVLVTACGRLCLHRKRINISTVLAGQRLGIKEVDEGIWLASFMHYDLGYFDLEQKTLQPLDNPFGTRLSPMS